jgi:hypothetical protein
MRTIRLAAPDGEMWEVRAFRVRLPAWRQIDVWADSVSGGGGLLEMALALVALPFTMVLIPLAIALVELPRSLARAAFSDTAWVEAACHYPGEERYLWRTTRADADGVRAAVAAQLSAGEHLRPTRAELVEHTSPAIP